MYLEGLQKLRKMCISLGANNHMMILPVGSVPKGTATAASDYDAKVIITSLKQEDGSYKRCGQKYAVSECARRLKKKENGTVIIDPSWSITYQSENPIHRLQMYLLVVILKHTKKDGSELSVSVDLQGCNDDSSIRNTLWVRSVTLGNECIPLAIMEIKRLSTSLRWTLTGYGLELLVIIALVRLRKIPIVDPLFPLFHFGDLSSVKDLRDYDVFYAGRILVTLHRRYFEMFEFKTVDRLEVLVQIDQMLEPRGKGPAVICLRDSDVMPNVKDPCLVIIDPCVCPGCPGKNVAHSLDSSGLVKIREDVKKCIISLR